jgi:hypothetical protein
MAMRALQLALVLGAVAVHGREWQPDDKTGDMASIVSTLQAGNDKDISNRNNDYDDQAAKCKKDNDDLVTILKDETDESKKQKIAIINMDAKLIKQNQALSTETDNRNNAMQKAADTTATMKEADAVHAQADADKMRLVQQVTDAVDVVNALGTSSFFARLRVAPAGAHHERRCQEGHLHGPGHGVRRAVIVAAGTARKRRCEVHLDQFSQRYEEQVGE